MLHHTLCMPSAEAHKLEAGRKTHHLHPARHDADFNYRPCPYRLNRDPTQPDQRIPIVDPTKKNVEPICYAELVEAPRRLTLAQATATKAQLAMLGHARIYDHQLAWLTAHDKRANINLADPAEVIDRYRKRWETRTVWLLHLRPTEKPRFLNRKGPTTAGEGEGDYVVDPRKGMADAGQAVPVVYQDMLSDEARRRDDDLRRGRGEGRDLKRAERGRERVRQLHKEIEQREREKAQK